MSNRRWSILSLILVLTVGACAEHAADPADDDPLADLDASTDLSRLKVPEAQINKWLHQSLRRHGFTGTVGLSLPSRLGRPIDQSLANTGRMLFFDPLLGLNDDNSCAGCHSPAHAFGDAQPIAIGIENNGIVGPGRAGPRNQRRTPNLTSIAFAPKLMWNGRFFAGSNNPFSNSGDFHFPSPEGTSLSDLSHLLDAQAFIPPTERVEMAGFDFPGDNSAIRAEVVNRVNSVQAYRDMLALDFPEVQAGGPLEYAHIAEAIAEFTFSLTRMNAPIDRFARGQITAMSREQKVGALLFFGRAKCSSCHAANSGNNEMFSDFSNYVIGVPQIVPANTNVTFDGPGTNEDFGLQQITGNPADRYKFRTQPLRNVSVQPSFMHNGAFTTLESAIRHHLNVRESVQRFTTSHLPPDLQGPIAPMDPVLALLTPSLQEPIRLTTGEFNALVEFVRVGLLDPDAAPSRLRILVPTALPSGLPPHRFEFPARN